MSRIRWITLGVGASVPFLLNVVALSDVQVAKCGGIGVVLLPFATALVGLVVSVIVKLLAGSRISILMMLLGVFIGTVVGFGLGSAAGDVRASHAHDDIYCGS